MHGSHGLPGRRIREVRYYNLVRLEVLSGATWKPLSSTDRFPPFEVAPMSDDHYENFPVASVLVPRRFRGPIAAIYWFARSADDIADEGDDPPPVRLAALNAYRRRLDDIERGVEFSAPQWSRLAKTVVVHRLPLPPFRDLLDAFSQDVVKSRYTDFAELDHYCRRSANPVGRLLLHLFGAATDQNIRDSDDICTALQLLNFCQDVRIDFDKNRIYIPQDEMAIVGIDEHQIARGNVDARWQRLFTMQLDRALALLDRGKPLALRVPGRFGLELRAIVAGGERIGVRLRATGGDVFHRRPTLSKVDWFIVAWRTLFPAACAPRATTPAAAP